MEGLGRLFDLSIGASPVDFTTAGATGKRCSMRESEACSVVVIKAAGTAAQDPTFTLKQHTASTGGTTANLAIIDHYYLKAEATLDGDETWTRVAQTAAATIADPGGAGTSAEEEQIIVIPVDASELSDGYRYISLDVADPGANAMLGTIFYILHDLHWPRKAANLKAPLS
jgi:hypothetical protein